MVTEEIETPTSTASVIETALAQLKGRALMYQRYHAYYSGAHDLTYSSQKYDEAFAKMVSKYAENLCPAVVDAVSDRLTVTSFTNETQVDQELANAAWTIWRRNRMDQRAGQVHTEALKEGDAYVIVWPDVQDTSLIRIWPQDANGITCYYDEDTLDLEWAAKWWLQDNGFGRLTIYYEDRIERYVTNNKITAQSGFATKASGLVEFQPPQDNPYGVVPVFHFANNAKIGMWGKSELADVIPVQDALNKAVCDMLVAMEFAAFPQRFATGVQVKLDEYGKPIAPWKPGVDRVWSTSNEDASFGQFEAADLNQMINAQNRFKSAIADISGTPQHYMQMVLTTYPSGESLKTAEARFVAKVKDRQVSFGNTWEDVMNLALKMMNVTVPDLTISTQWEDASTRNDLETASIGVMKNTLGIPQTQIWREMGYSEDQIKTMQAEKATQDEASMQRQQALFQRGGPTPPFGGGPNA